MEKLKKNKNDPKTHVNSKHVAKFVCTVCNKSFMTKSLLEEHIKKNHKGESELNCNDCQFQANTRLELKKHLNTKKHKASNSVDESSLGDTFKCKVCKDEFCDWWNLMNHRRDTHPEARRRCRNDLNGVCDFPSDEGPKGCWWSHASKKPSSLQSPKSDVDHKCNVCEKVLDTKFNMMTHKKAEHFESVQICKNFLIGRCEFIKCWFRHGETKNQNMTQEASHEAEPSTEVFQEVSNKTKPPEINQLKEIVLQAMQMIATVNKKLESMTN